MGRNTDEKRQAFAELCAARTYNEIFEHPERAKLFSRSVLGEVLARHTERASLRILDAGTGTGAWLTETAAFLEQSGYGFELAGFDHTTDMVAVAQRRIQQHSLTANFSQGDITDETTFGAFDSDGVDLIIVYDVLQQLPRACRRRTVDRLKRRSRPGVVW